MCRHGSTQVEYASNFAYRKSIARRITPGGLPSSSTSLNFRPARADEAIEWRSLFAAPHESESDDVDGSSDVARWVPIEEAWALPLRPYVRRALSELR